MSEQTHHLVEALRQRLSLTGRRVTMAELWFGLVLTAGVFTLLWLLSTAVEAGFWLGPTPRVLLLGTVLLVTAALAVYFLILPLLRLWNVLPGPTDEGMARRIGSRYPEVSDRLVNLLHLADGRRSDAPDTLLDGAIRMLEAQVRPVRFEQVEDFGRVRRAGRWAGIPVACLILFVLAAPSLFLGASERLLSPMTAFERPAPFQLLVEPGTYELVRGEPLEISVHTAGRQLPRSLTLLLNNRDEDHVEEVVFSADSAGVFRHTVVNVRNPLRYQVVASPVESRWYNVTVTERPLVRSMQLRLDFPSYTNIPPQRLEANVGNVSALAGTKVSLEVAVGGRDLQDARIRFGDGVEDTLAIQGPLATGSFVLTQDGTYQVVLRNEQGVENETPITYAIDVLNDAPPSVTLLSPEQESNLTDELRADLLARIQDDFGFSRLHLDYRLAESRYGGVSESFQSVPLPLADRRQVDQEILHTWLLSGDSGLDPVPGDVIEYYLQVWDNDAVAGFKSARSSIHRLRVPSLAEQYRQLDEGQDVAETELEDLLRDTEAVRDQFQELRDELRSKQETDWEDQRQIERIQQQQQSLENRVESMSRHMESLTQQMEENNLATDETLQEYQELQKVIEEINAPELQEALRQLQEAMQQLNLQQLQQSIGDFEFNEEQFRQRLERTLELFQRIRVQQGLDEAANRAEELARQQEELARETGEMQEESDPTDQGEQQNPQEEQQDRQGEAEQGEQSEEGEPENGEQNEQNRPGEQGEQPDEERRQGEQQSGQEQENRQNQERDPNASQQNDQEAREQLAQEQERSREEMEALEEQLRQMQEQMEQLRNTPRQQMEQLNQQLQQQQMPQQMQQNSEQLRQNELQQAQQGQQQMQQQMQQLQQQLQQMQQGMQGQQQQMDMAGLRRSLENVLTLSGQQEDLQSSVRALNSESPNLREFAQQQSQLSEGLRVVSDSLQRLSRSIPEMSREVQVQTGQALREMASATDAMAERQTAMASGHQQASMTHLNELALRLSELMDQMMNGQGGQGGMSMQQMTEQLQNMAGQQQQLNQQIQEMLNNVQGNRLSPDMQQRLQQMSAQQQAIRQQLQELSRNPDARGQVLGDLNRIAEQMEESIQELQRSQLNRPLIERQQQILSRLLDAQKSMQERGRERRRESQTGQDSDRSSPAGLTPDEQVDKLRQDLIRALESGYAPDYEELIRRYFELLQNQAQPAGPQPQE